MSSLVEEAPDEPITKARMRAALDRYLAEHSGLRN
jgi:hypothetical protein